MRCLRFCDGGSDFDNERTPLPVLSLPPRLRQEYQPDLYRSLRTGRQTGVSCVGGSRAGTC
mgnify:FL=1